MAERKLTDYLPRAVAGILEYQALAAAEQPEMERLQARQENLRRDQFVKDATETGMCRWEKCLSIVPRATDTLEERKFTVLSRLNQWLPHTVITLREQLEILCGKDGYSLEMDYNAYALQIAVALTAKSNLLAVHEMLQRVVPANIVITLSLKYNQYAAFARNTHGQLTAHTHHSLRNEVLT